MYDTLLSIPRNWFQTAWAKELCTVVGVQAVVLVLKRLPQMDFEIYLLTHGTDSVV